MTATPSFNLNAIFNKWVAILTRPSEAAFEAEKPNVNPVDMLVWLAIGGAISGVLLALRKFDIIGMFTGFISGAIGAIVVYLIFQAVLYVIARFLGGTGEFLTQAYLQSLYYVPIFIANAVLQLVPFIGPIAGLVVGLYGLYLTTLALKVTHHYDTNKAILTWAIPVGVMVVLAACALTVAGATFFLTMLGLSH